MKLNNVDLNKVAVFCQILESGNYRRASDVLNVTPSALSQTLSVLEHSLGFPLFLRAGKKLIPTQKGIELHKEFRLHHSAMLQAVEMIMNEQKEVRGILRIGAYFEFAKTRLTPFLHQFLKQYPDAQIKLIFDSPSRLADQIVRRKLDFCFSIFPSQEKGKIRSTRIMDEELVLITPTKWLGKNPDYAEVLGSPMIEYYLNHQLIRRWFALHYKKRPKNLPVRAFVSHADMVIAMVTEGSGIGVVPEYLLDSERRKRIEIFRPTNRKLMDNLWLLEPEHSQSSALEVAFRNKVREHF